MEIVNIILIEFIKNMSVTLGVIFHKNKVHGFY